MSEKTFVCPQPMVWNNVYDTLCKVAEERSISKPLIPLILAAWWDTPAMMKMIRWNETVEWASTHKLEHLIPDLLEEQKYFLGE